MPGSAMIGNLAVNLTMETAAFQKGANIAEKRAEAMRSRFAAAGKSVAGLGAALGVGIGVAAISSLARNAFEMASALDESSQKMGVTVEALQELNLAAEQSGVSQETLAASMGKLNRSLGDLQLGKKSAVDAFAQIGLSADELKGKSPDQALRLIADALNKLPSVQERVSVGSQIMGRGFSQLLPLINGGSAALDAYAVKSREAGQISTEDAKKLDELADSWERLKVRVGVATANMIAGVARFASSTDAWIFKWYALRDGAIASVGQMATSVVNAINNMVSSIGQAITGRLTAIWDGAKAKIQSVTDAFKTMWDKVVGHSYVPDMVTAIGAEMGPRLQAMMVDPAIEKTNQVIEGFGAMAAGTIGAVQSMVKTFKSGDVLGGIQQFLELVLNVVKALGQIGVIKLPSGGTPTPRASGGPVSPGRSYLVGEQGPEVVQFGSKGYVHPNRANNQAMKIQIVPSPYFDAVVDSRSKNVAAPMAGQAAVLGVAGSEARRARQMRRSIP